MFRALLIATLVFSAPGSTLRAQGICNRDAMLVFDGSGSMAEMGYNLLNEPRIHSARRAVVETLPAAAELRRIGLLIYGPNGASSCNNTHLHFTPMARAAQPVIDAIDRLSPDGETPLTQAVLEAAEALNYETTPGIVVLVTDGDDTCGGDPCQLGKMLRAQSADLVIHVIGFKIDPPHFSWPSSPDTERTQGNTQARCLADLTGGHYVHARDTAELSNALRQTLGCPLYSRLSMPPLPAKQGNTAD